MESSDCVVAIVDDDVAVRRALGRLVRSLSYEPVAYESGERFLASLEEDAPYCVVLDQHMPGMNGLDVLIAMRERGSRAPVIMVTGVDQPGMSEKCLNAGAAAYLTKPVDRSAIGRAIEEATAKK